jgi:phage terminase large subunit-like protein/lambda repressor-like predicted transcriptional regulator
VREYAPHECRLIRRALRDPLAFHRPTPAQQAWHDSDARIKLLRGGNQVGKTTALAVETFRAAEDHGPGFQGRIVCYSYPQSLVVQRKFHDLCPRRLLDAEAHFHPSRGWRHRRIPLKGGGAIDFVTTEGGSLAMASATLDYIGFDEPPDPGSWSEGVARVTATGGRVVATLTPVGRPMGYLRAQVDEGVVEDFAAPLSTENCPWLTQEQIDEVVAATLEAERPQRIEGAWEGVTPERLLSAYSDDALFDDDAATLPKRELSIGLGFDWAERSMGTVGLLAAFDRSTYEVWFLDEYESAGKTTVDQDAISILAMLDRHGLSLAAVDVAFGDHNSAGKSQLTTVNRLMSEALARASGVPEHAIAAGRLPLRIEAARKGGGSVMFGARVLNLALASERLRISRRCARLIDGCRHWKGEKTGRNAEVKDALDAARYLAVPILDTRTVGVSSVRLR